VIWAALLLMVALAAPAIWAWYISGRQLAATTEPQQWRVLRLAAVVSAGSASRFSPWALLASC
jgi:hypothetical protein